MARLGEWLRVVPITGAMMVAACGGGSSNSPMPTPTPAPAPTPTPTPTPSPQLDPQYRASAPSPFAANCDGVPALGTVYANAEVEPSLAINPMNTQNVAAVWQQDRWSTGGSRGIVAGFSTDGGKSWMQHAMPYSRCGGGNAGNGGDYARTSNPWITASPDGTLNQLAIAFSGALLTAGSTSAVVASRSTDGGATWSATKTLIRDVDAFFNDKGAITADPVSGHFVYAVWDRITNTAGPTLFTRSSDGGQTWEAVRAIYDPGVNNQTISNVIVVTPNGTLVNLFVEIIAFDANNFSASLRVIRSTDNGASWSAPSTIAQLLAVGTRDPDTGTLVRDGALIPEIAVAPNGTLYVTWQDARFSGGVRDGVALSHSSDGGLTWSAPLQANSVTSVAAFLPNVHVRGDGTIGVSYYDLRDNTPTTATLLTGYWLARSSNGNTWTETRIAGPFDLAVAPFTTSPAPGGYFLGDYQALLSVGNVFTPMFMQTTADVSNRTDVFYAPQVSATTAVAKEYRAPSTTAVAPSPEFRQRVSAHLANALRARLPRDEARN